MDTLKAVIDDLFRFVFIEFFGFAKQFPSNTKTPIYLSSPAGQQALPAVTTPGAQFVSSTVAPQREPEIFAPASSVTVIESATELFMSPVLAFDSVLATLPYGKTLSVFGSRNRWYEVDCGGQRGWVLRDAVTVDNIHPQFKLGQLYDADNKETIKLRAYIKDEFAGSIVEVPLTDVEYVTYRILKKGNTISWGKDRPRTAGRWQQLLRGRTGVHIGIFPKTDSVMEFISETDIGHVVYVDAVFPDESVLISEIGFPDPAQYNERTLLKEEWKELRPVFIEVS